MNGAFGQLAFHLCDIGLTPVPVGGTDGKRPLMKGYHKRHITPGNVVDLQMRFEFANVALLCGPSNINVLDIDDPALLRAMIKRFGDSPLIVKTAGKGGFQVYYRANAKIEPMDFRFTEKLPVEIKAKSNIVLIPPSRNPITGRRYEFVRGELSPEMMQKLPVFRAEAIYPAGTSEVERRAIEQGRRNKWLFAQCMREARACDDFAALLDVAETRNDECNPPLSMAEVTRIATSAWRYTDEGRNWHGSEGGRLLSKTDVHELARLFPGNEVLLWLKLDIEHGHRMRRDEAFKLATAAMAKAGTLPGWSRDNYRAAVAKLIDADLLQIAQPGQRRIATTYTLTPWPRKQA